MWCSVTGQVVTDVLKVLWLSGTSGLIHWMIWRHITVGLNLKHSSCENLTSWSINAIHLRYLDIQSSSSSSPPPPYPPFPPPLPSSPPTPPSSSPLPPPPPHFLQIISLSAFTEEIKLKVNHIWNDINVKLRVLWETCLSATHDLKLQGTFTGVVSIVLTRLAQLMLHGKKMYYFHGSMAFDILQHRGCNNMSANIGHCC